METLALLRQAGELGRVERQRGVPGLGRDPDTERVSSTGPALWWTRRAYVGSWDAGSASNPRVLGEGSRSALLEQQFAAKALLPTLEAVLAVKRR